MIKEKLRTSFPVIRPPRPWIPYIVLIIALGLTVATSYLVYRSTSNIDQARFANQTERIKSAVRFRITIYRAVLRSGASIFTSQGDIDHADFVSFLKRQRLQERFPGIQGIGVARRTRRESVDSLISAMRRTEYSDFNIFSSNDSAESGDSTLFPIIFLEPQTDRNRAAIGYDMYSDSGRRDAMDLARDSARSWMTEKVRLKQETKGRVQAGFLIYAPTYAGETIPQTVQERRERLRGYVYAPFRADDLFTEIDQDIGTPYVDFEVYDGETTDTAQILHDSRWHQDSTERISPRLSSVDTLNLAGRVWTFRFFSAPLFETLSDRQSVPLILVTGLLFSVMIFLLTRSQLQSIEQLRSTALRLRQTQQELAQVNETLEHRVDERTVELQSSNEELKAFAYSVSHDLRAPLRSIDGFSKFLIEDYGDTLDAMGMDYLRRIREASHRMGDIIDDLLMLSRVTRWELSREEVDMTAIATEILDRLGESDPERIVHVHVQPGMTGMADSRLIRVAMENLLENAWKFTSRKPEADIWVEQRPGTDNPSVTEYVIRDNGAGFEQKYATTLFDSFRRLHSPQDFTGTGIGLATVKRVIQRHGGTITGKGVVDEGAEFVFTLE